MVQYRLASMTGQGKIVEHDLTDISELARQFEQIGVEEDSYSLRLHGQPVFQGLIGPLSEGPSKIRYETPEAYVALTEIWAKTRRPRRRRNAEPQD